MTICLVFISYNRLDYIKPAFASVLGYPREEFSLTTWENSLFSARYIDLENNLFYNDSGAHNG